MWFFLKYRSIHFHINSISIIRTVKQNQLIFFSIEINKQLSVSVHSVSQIRFKFRSQLQLLPQIRYLFLFRVESSIISIDSHITDNIIRKVINVQQEKCWTKNEALRKSSINCIFLRILPIQSNSKRSITEKI